MPRWEPDPRGRLERAAITLFAEQGYEATTVDQIAAAAGLARSGFFRHFRDKRDVLAGGHDSLESALRAGILAAPPEQSALRATETAWAEVATTWFAPERRDLAAKRFAVVSSSADLRERELLKRRGLADAVAAALQARGVPHRAAAVAAELSILAFAETVMTWGDPTSIESFDHIYRRVLADLRRALGELG